jgi:AcrR family transcriptional regulator
VRRTRDRLAVALRGLMQQKTLHEITVQDVLNEAGVSRSAFYAHFSSTQDLLLADMDEFLEMVANHFCGVEQVARIVPVREFFSHVGEAEQIREALVRSDRLSDFYDLAREHFARGICRRLRELPYSRELPKIEREALAHALAGALMSHLEWWLRQRRRLPAEQMDRKFHALAWAAIACANPSKGSERILCSDRSPAPEYRPSREKTSSAPRQLLPTLSDGRQAARRPRTLTFVAG